MPTTATKIMLIRHAEKPADDGTARGVAENGDPDAESLTVRGWQRAGALACLFAPGRGPLQDQALGRPDTIFASETAPDEKSQRPLQTITPLARLLELTPRTLKRHKIEELVAEARECVGTVLICWQHEDIPAIARLIANDQGSIPKKWPKERFDVVWVFDLDEGSGSYVFSQVPQRLLEGDVEDVIPLSAT